MNTIFEVINKSDIHIHRDILNHGYRENHNLNTWCLALIHEIHRKLKFKTNFGHEGKRRPSLNTYIPNTWTKSRPILEFLENSKKNPSLVLETLNHFSNFCMRGLAGVNEGFVR